MKVHKIELIVVDFEDYGPDDISIALENAKPFYPTVLDVKTVEIGDWNDNNLLNFKSTVYDEAKRLFGD